MCRWSPRDDLEYQADDKGKKKGVDTYELRVANGRPSTVRPIQFGDPPLLENDKIYMKRQCKRTDQSRLDPKYQYKYGVYNASYIQRQTKCGVDHRLSEICSGCIYVKYNNKPKGHLSCKM